MDQSPVRGTKLKERLYAAGLKHRACEMCGQGEEWHGRRMALILDHINGVRDDNRLANLRIVCPNCNATLDTHCGRNKRTKKREPRACVRCGDVFVPRRDEQRYCSRACGSRHERKGRLNRQARKVERPPLEDLLALVEQDGYLAVGRLFGVSDNAIRKWIRAYGATPPPGPGHRIHPPPRPAHVLSDEQARQALEMLAEGVSMYRVAKVFGISQKTVRQLRDGLTYRHLPRRHEFPLKG